MLKQLLVIFFLSLSLCNYGQNNFVNKFGEISQSEIELEFCPIDSLASAMVLFDLGHSRFDETNTGFIVKFKRHKRIKIFQESGRDYSSITIPYYAPKKQKKEKISALKAFTYNLVNGKIEKKELDTKNVFDEKINKNWHQKKFVFPDVQEGSILEYSYEYTSPYIFNLVDWEFQTDIPTKYSEYKVNMVPYYEYVSIAQRINKFDINTSEKSNFKRQNYKGGYYEQIHTYALKNIEAFKDEKFITTKDDYIKKIDFQLSKIYHGDGMIEDIIKTWESLRIDLMDDTRFGGYLKRCRGLAKKVLENELTLDGLNNKEKIDRIVDYVKDQLHFNEITTKYAKLNPKEVFDSKSGNVAEINLFLNALLNEAGIEAYPMILSTRKHGKINTLYPLNSFTNYVAVVLKKEKMLVDATQNSLDNMLIPPNCINELGLIVDKKSEDQWMRIHYGKASVEFYNVNHKINADELQVNSRLSSKNMMFEADYYRRKWGNSTSKIKNYYEDSFNDIEDVMIIGNDDRSKPYSYNFNATSEIEELGDYILFNPLNGIAISENPFISEKRNYPVDFTYATQSIYKVNIFIPKNYKPLTLNKNITLDNENINLSYKYDFNEKLNVINLVASYKFKKPIYGSEDYKSLKENTQKIVEIINEKLTLEKTNENLSADK